MMCYDIKIYLEKIPANIKFKDVVSNIQEKLGIKILIDIEFYEAIQVEGIEKTLCQKDDEYSFSGTLEEYENGFVKTYGDVINDLDTPYDATIKYRFNEEKSTLEVLVYRKFGWEVDEEDYSENEEDYDDWDSLLSSFLKGE